MYPHDDTAGAALRAAGEDARPLGTPGYDSGQVLLALLRAEDPVSRCITQAEPRITARGVRDRLDGPLAAPADTGRSRFRAGHRSGLVPAAEFREATSRFTATWRPHAQGRRLRPAPRLGTGELWATVPEPGTVAHRSILTLGVDPDAIRELVLAAMAPPGQQGPAWPGGPPRGPVQRLIARLPGSRARA